MPRARVGGTLSGRTVTTASPGICSWWREVTRNVRSGQAATIACTRSRAASSRCWAPSATSSWCRDRSAAAMSATPASGSPVTPRAAANAGTRSSDRETPGTGNHRTPSAYPSAPTASTAASRVLPTPPGPVRVTSRWSASSSRIAIRSASRPSSGSANVGGSSEGSDRGGGGVGGAGSSAAKNRLALVAGEAERVGEQTEGGHPGGSSAALQQGHRFGAQTGARRQPFLRHARPLAVPPQLAPERAHPAPTSSDRRAPHPSAPLRRPGTGLSGCCPWLGFRDQRKTSVESRAVVSGELLGARRFGPGPCDLRGVTHGERLGSGPRSWGTPLNHALSWPGAG